MILIYVYGFLMGILVTYYGRSAYVINKKVGVGVVLVIMGAYVLVQSVVFGPNTFSSTVIPFGLGVWLAAYYFDY